MNETLPRPAQPSLWEATKYWLKLGFISFGGPAGQIAIMHQELVEKRRWISEHRFLHGLNYCMLLPGPEAIQLAIYISWLMHGVVGAIIAGVLFFLPAFVLLSALAAVYLAYGDVTLVQGIFYGIKPAVVAVVLYAAWRIGSRALNNNLLYAMAALAFIGVFFFKIDFPWIVLAAAYSVPSAVNSCLKNLKQAVVTVPATRHTVRHSLMTKRHRLRMQNFHGENW